MMAEGNGRNGDVIALPKWLAGFVTGAMLLIMSGGIAWLFRMESRVSVTETNSQWTQNAIQRIEAKLDRALDGSSYRERAEP